MDDLMSPGSEDELRAKIHSMLQQPARTPMPADVAAGVLEAIVLSDKTPVVNIQRKRYGWWVAACMALLAAGATYLWLSPKGTPVEERKVVTKAVEDIPPGVNKAVLTLADGTQVTLDSSAAGSLPVQGTTKIFIHDKGTLSYHANQQSATSAPLMYNTISTPNGGQYQVVLPDGSKVWLNAASSIRFSTSFNGERKVTMTGEAYFEVAEDKKHPFLVSADTLLIQVLGTHFNIKAYANDGATKTSLVTGSLKANDRLLKPGQAYVNGQVIQTNTDHDIAWKNGLFNLTEVDFKDFMRQVERWYDVKVQYDGAVPGMEFQGKLNRAVPLSDILDYLKKLDVDCQLKGKTLLVKQLK